MALDFAFDFAFDRMPKRIEHVLIHRCGWRIGSLPKLLLADWAVLVERVDLWVFLRWPSKAQTHKRAVKWLCGRLAKRKWTNSKMIIYENWPFGWDSAGDSRPNRDDEWCLTAWLWTKAFSQNGSRMVVEWCLKNNDSKDGGSSDNGTKRAIWRWEIKRDKNKWV